MYQRWNGSVSNIEFRKHSGFFGHTSSASGKTLTIQSGAYTQFKYIQSNGGSGTYATFDKSASGTGSVGYVQLYGGSSKVLTTHTNLVKILNDLDVDGHTNLDNVSIAGVTTFAANARFNSTIGVHDGTTGANGQYLRATGTGVTWGSFPTMRTSQTFTASSGQTSFSFTYNVGYLDVFVNGVKLSSSEFTANNGSTVVLSVGSFVGDIVELVSYFTTSYAAGESGITELVQDPTPQLGGNLDLFNKTVEGTGNVNMTGVVTATKFVGDGSSLSGLASREFYGFVGVGSHLQLVYTNNGADNISSTSYASLEENFFGPSGITFEINTDGRLIATV